MEFLILAGLIWLISEIISFIWSAIFTPKLTPQFIPTPNDILTITNVIKLQRSNNPIPSHITFREEYIKFLKTKDGQLLIDIIHKELDDQQKTDYLRTVRLSMLENKEIV